MESEVKRENSIFDTRSVESIYDEIRHVYLSDNRPWVIGYSGGKDSTATLQLVWYAISGIPVSKRTKPIHVITSDTMVETPMITRTINKSIQRINEISKNEKLPITAEKVMPIVTDSFWVSLLGKGYPAPSTKFRWCTERLKIKPADRFILDKVSKYGEVVVVLGSRKSESATRAQVMKLYKMKGSLLSRHSRFAQTWIYTPVEDFSVGDVWNYLLKTKNPWGAENRDLLALYQSANAGECPLVIDDSTPSCGNSRFGCWVCTVVQKDHSMEALVDGGEEWLEPLLEIRNYLASTQDPEKKHLYRDYKRKSGRVEFKSDGSGKITRGPYTLDFCKDMLKKLLIAQEKIKKMRPKDAEDLIIPEELHEIRKIWVRERGDWDDSVPKIYKDATGRNLNWECDDYGMFQALDKEVLVDVCMKKKVPIGLISKLMDIERQYQGMGRRASIYDKLGAALAEEWRSEEEMVNMAKSKKGEPDDD